MGPTRAWRLSSLSPNFLLALLFLCPLATAQTNPFAGDPKAAEAGRGAFRIYCSPCHGIHGKGGRGPDLTLGVYTAGDKDQDLYRVIANGVPGSEMSDYGETFDSDGLWQLVTYVRSIAERREVVVRGDASAGEKVFWDKARCGQCHQVGSRGGRLGPELTRAGRMRSLAYLRESIVSPNADITPGYPTLRVQLRDGKEIVGVQRGIDNFSAQLIDLAENSYSFLRSEVRSVQREFRSVMPADYEKRLTPGEIEDVVAFLTKLRGGEK